MRPSKFQLPLPGKSLALLFATALYLPATAPAATSLTARASGSYGPGVPTQTTTSGTASQSQSGSGQRGDNKSDSSVSFGILRLYSEAHSLAGSSPTLIFANNSASWRDDFLISSTALNGQAGRLTLSLQIDGNLTGSGNESASQSSNRSRTTADYDFYQNGGKIGTGSETHYVNNGEIVGDVFLNQKLTFTLDFVFGTPFEMRLDVSSGAASYSTGSTAVGTLADLSHTATWGGISSVTNTQGTPVAYSFSSASGTDFTQAIVPEPGTFALVVMAGAGVLAGIWRRREMAVASRRQRSN